MRIETDGRPATAAELFSTYGHFTALQVRGGGVQGLANHLERLDAAHRELFRRPLPGERVRELVRHALDGTADASVRVTLRDADRVTVSVADPRRPPAAPQRLRSVPYLRPFPHLKHLGGFAQLEWARRVRLDGYDDALLTAPDGALAESSTANIGFLQDDGTVVWPDAPQLHGTAMRLVEATTPSSRQVVRSADVAAFAGAFLVNSIGVVAVASVDDVPLPDPGHLLAGVVERLAAVPWEPA
ncbi:aminotransferase class IV [Promicromonospora iranensis]|uniref:Branched-subunit amino acid aminotransferase/4-amino-4-deoxychorismate lyase n=1 Tax=Promicromonospora iranensis TaxID=1105144 RepID=A0ABU2CKF9_9MICO|nr:aminotransferase class IV [Promicromonospora iranensis]MDR7381829.1 branched-subunit amino acid aminotransferase/4-amino-4-deoxychorismate lyase [Promicromonospora iranensis]